VTEMLNRPIQALREATDEDTVVDYIKRVYATERDNRRPYAMQWYLNIAFYLGHQHLGITPYGTLTKDLDEPEHRRIVTENAIQPRVDRILARATQDPPIIEAVAPSSDDNDINSAEVATNLLEHHQYAQRLKRKDTSTLQWAAICAKGFYKTIWNPKAGERIRVPVTETIEQPVPDVLGLPTVGEDGEQVTQEIEIPVIDEETGEPKYEEIAIGDVEVITCSPFEVFPIGDGETMDDPGVTGALHVVPRTIRYIEDVYDVRVDPQDELKDSDDIYRELTEQLGTMSGGRDSERKHDKGEPSALVYEYWEKPSDERPRGRFVVVAGSELIKDEELPYDYLDVPFDEVESCPVPGRFWGTSRVEQAVPVQRTINFLAAKIEEHTDVMVDPKVIRIKGDGIGDDEWVNEAGEHIFITSAAHMPNIWTPPALGSDVYARLDKLYGHLDDLFGVHDVSRAQAPGEVTAGVAIAQLQEQDDTMQGPFYRSYHRAREGVGRKIVSLCQQFYQETRQLKIVGANKRWQLADFQASDVEGITDVRVRQTSSMPQSRVGAQQFVFELLQRAPQMYSDPVTGQFDVIRLSEDLKLGSVRHLYDAIQVDLEHAQRENERMQQGGMPNPLFLGDQQRGIPPGIGPNQWDNHPTHYKEHTRYMKTGEFERLPQQVQQVFQQHAQMHAQVLAAQTPPAQAQTPTKGQQR